MRAFSLLLLRISLGLLLVIWGVDKLVNVEHAIAVSDRFYLGVVSAPLLWKMFGVLQLLLGAAVITGLWQRYTYPAQAIVNGITLLGVWRSVVDPWGWYLEGTNVLFYPSLIVFAGCLVLWAFRDEDRLAPGRR
ncbi:MULTISPECIES: DoxX family membrane protein [Microbulbifer]|uniref:DoxX family membrane protein n=1 Tax=Microbulbifer TaxID=48073 RepID=UPI001E4F5F99|nr:MULTISPECIES: DoxX family membrane protein [Microbulbifer]UHQ53893.1 DoxX family membrane protein [Microbulbifer sp. YPW16]